MADAFNDTFPATANQIVADRNAAGLQGLVLGIDHVAYRVKTGDREKALAEFLRHTNYGYVETHFMPEQNALTSVLSYPDQKPAIVVSEGLDENSVVAKYVAKFGARIHHIAFDVTDIDEVVRIQKGRGVTFTTDDVIGNKDEGLLQIFTEPSALTGDIYEYVQRFGDFKGFFLQSHVGALMSSTQKFNE